MILTPEHLPLLIILAATRATSTLTRDFATGPRLHDPHEPVLTDELTHEMR
jgi:hypothetical protein